MSTGITVSCDAEKVHFFDNADLTDPIIVPFRPPDKSQEDWIELVRRLGHLAEKYSTQIKLEEIDRDTILAHLAKIGLELASYLFPNQGWSVIGPYLRSFPNTDLEVYNYVWIPWEIFYYGQELDKPTYQGFCGYQRTIYRVTRPRERVLPLTSKLQLGFLPFSGWVKGSIMSSAKDIEEVGFESIEDQIILKEFSALNPEKRRQREITRLRHYLREAHLVHFSSLITSVLEHSFLLLDNGFWLSIDDFIKIIPNDHFIFNNLPLIFFNVRDNYTRNPLHILKYVQTFHDLEALGVIASTLPMPNYLAAHFPERFYKTLLQDGQLIGRALAETKQYFLDQLNNPFALFYVPYLSPASKMISSSHIVEAPAQRAPDKHSRSSVPRNEVSRNKLSTRGELKMKLSLSHNDRRRLSDELNEFPDWVDGDKIGEKGVLRDAGLPRRWVNRLRLTGTPITDASTVISSLESLGHLVERPTHKALGALVEYLLNETIHLEGRLFLAHLIEHYQLITNLDYLHSLRQKYALLRRSDSDSLLDLGRQSQQPDFVWQGPTDLHQLEAIWQKKALFLDAVFLEKGAKAARAVCRVEINGRPKGTGFLIAPHLVLTNHHVLQTDESAKIAQVRFGYRIDRSGQLQQGEIYQVKGALRRSPVKELDYVVLEVEDSPGAKDEIGVLSPIKASLKTNQPAFIIQHPQGEPQKVVLQENWMTYVATDLRRVQYLTNTMGGSSGSPVFNEKWEVVALHHSGQPVPALPEKMNIRGNEGIPMVTILPEIQDLLT